jgi:hypothetical protein
MLNILLPAPILSKLRSIQFDYPHETRGTSPTEDFAEQMARMVSDLCADSEALEEVTITSPSWILRTTAKHFLEDSRPVPFFEHESLNVGQGRETRKIFRRGWSDKASALEAEYQAMLPIGDGIIGTVRRQHSFS